MEDKTATTNLSGVKRKKNQAQKPKKTESPVEIKAVNSGAKNASLLVSEQLQSSSDSGSAASSLADSSTNDWPGQTLMESSFDAPMAPFPSLEAKQVKKRASQHEKNDAGAQMHQLQSYTTLLSDSLGTSAKVPGKKGRPRKPVVDPPLPKRPVGRPRIHPRKSVVVDPNKPKRGTGLQYIYLHFITVDLHLKGFDVS